MPSRLEIKGIVSGVQPGYEGTDYSFAIIRISNARNGIDGRELQAGEEVIIKPPESTSEDGKFLNQWGLTFDQQRAVEDAILGSVSNAYDIQVKKLKGRSRTRSIAEARQVAMYFLRGLGWPLKNIGLVLGRDHSTVIHGVEKVKARKARDPHFEGTLEFIWTDIVISKQIDPKLRIYFEED